MNYIPNNNRYTSMIYRSCGQWGLKLPALSLGLWHNFGETDNFENAQTLVRKAFDLGITHFDLANNYGPPPGSAEKTFAKILKTDLLPYRDEIVISTKAGYYMWEGPYGDWGSRKYLISSLDQSLKRLEIPYVDIFYHHRPDPHTPLEETMTALDSIVRSGKALYVGLSNYGPDEFKKALKILKDLGTPCLIHQPRYSLFNRAPEQTGLLTAVKGAGVGCIAFSPLAKGLLSDRYLQGIPADSRAAGPSVFLRKDEVTEEKISKVKKLKILAESRGQSVAQMALAWVLRDSCMTSALIGASKVSQIEENAAALSNIKFSEKELQTIDSIVKD